LGGVGAIDRQAITLFLIGLPLALAGTWAGLKLYGRLDERGFRTLVLLLLLASGAALLIPLGRALLAD
jgi:uncharacterized protein